MSTVLIGFLGRGTYWQGERKPYWRTRYRFVDWTSQRVTFFLHATIDWLQYKHGKLPDRVVVLGTSGSMWDEMVSALCSPQDPRDRERIEGHCLELIARVDDQSVSQSDLETVQSILSDALQVSVHAELIPPAKEQHESACAG